MPKKNGHRYSTERLGISWGEIKADEPFYYNGTLTGLKNNISRANRLYRPKRFRWWRDKYMRMGKTITRYRVERYR